MRDWKSVLGVVLVFVLGAFAGAALAFIIVHHRVERALQRGTPAYEEFLERRLTRGLHLDSGQRERLHDVLVSNLEERKKIQLQVQPQVHALTMQTRQQIVSILSPEQLTKFSQNLQAFRRQFGAPGLVGNGPRPKISSGDTNAPPIGDTNATPQAN